MVYDIMLIVKDAYKIITSKFVKNFIFVNILQKLIKNNVFAMILLFIKALVE